MRYIIILCVLSRCCTNTFSGELDDVRRILKAQDIGNVFDDDEIKLNIKSMKDVGIVSADILFRVLDDNTLRLQALKALLIMKPHLDSIQLRRIMSIAESNAVKETASYANLILLDQPNGFELIKKEKLVPESINLIIEWYCSHQREILKAKGDATVVQFGKFILKKFEQLCEDEDGAAIHCLEAVVSYLVSEPFSRSEFSEGKAAIFTFAFCNVEIFFEEHGTTRIFPVFAELLQKNRSSVTKAIKKSWDRSSDERKEVLLYEFWESKIRKEPEIDQLVQAQIKNAKIKEFDAELSKRGDADDSKLYEKYSKLFNTAGVIESIKPEDHLWDWAR